MKNWQRKFLFFFFLFLFLILGPSLVLYSVGYRLDWEKKKITQTGGIFVKAQPKEVKISIGEKLVKRTDFFFGSALIENLLPKRYKIRIEKEGYFPWEKELEVEEKKVTEIRNLILFPQNLNLSLLSKNVEDFWFSPDGKKIILKEKENEGWALKLYLIENKVKSHLIEKNDFSKKEEVEILNLEFFENSKEIEIEAKIGKEVKNFSLDLTKTPQLREKVKTKIPETILCYQLKNGISCFLEKSGFLFKGDAKFENKEKINEIPISVKEKEECEITVWENFFFLEKGENLFLLNQETKSFEKFFEGLKGMRISPDFNKISLFSNSEIWIFEKNGEKKFLNRFSEKIENLYWINENYLIFQTQNKIKISETDTRDKVNVFDILEIEIKKFFFNQADQKIYILKEENFYYSEPLLR